MNYMNPPALASPEATAEEKKWPQRRRSVSKWPEKKTSAD